MLGPFWTRKTLETRGKVGWGFNVISWRPPPPSSPSWQRPVQANAALGQRVGGGWGRELWGPKGWRPLRVGANRRCESHAPDRDKHHLKTPSIWKGQHQSKRHRPVSAAFSCPEPEFLLAACVQVNSCTDPRRHERITNQPEDAPYGGFWHSSAVLSPTVARVNHDWSRRQKKSGWIKFPTRPLCSPPTHRVVAVRESTTR